MRFDWQEEVFSCRSAISQSPSTALTQQHELSSWSCGRHCEPSSKRVTLKYLWVQSPVCVGLFPLQSQPNIQAEPGNPFTDPHNLDPDFLSLCRQSYAFAPCHLPECLWTPHPHPNSLPQRFTDQELEEEPWSELPFTPSITAWAHPEGLRVAPLLISPFSFPHWKLGKDISNGLCGFLSSPDQQKKMVKWMYRVIDWWCISLFGGGAILLPVIKVTANHFFPCSPVWSQLSNHHRKQCNFHSELPSPLYSPPLFRSKWYLKLTQRISIVSLRYIWRSCYVSHYSSYVVKWLWG